MVIKIMTFCINALRSIQIGILRHSWRQEWFFKETKGWQQKLQPFFFCSSMAVPGKRTLWKNNTKGD